MYVYTLVKESDFALRDCPIGTKDRYVLVNMYIKILYIHMYCSLCSIYDICIYMHTLVRESDFALHDDCRGSLPGMWVAVHGLCKADTPEQPNTEREREV